MHFLYTDRYGNFAVSVKIVLINDNDNRCISGVFGWDFGFSWFYQKFLLHVFAS